MMKTLMEAEENLEDMYYNTTVLLPLKNNLLIYTVKWYHCSLFTFLYH